ncbi:MAG: glycosyltransferase [Sphingomonadaceae bacterium]
MTKLKILAWPASSTANRYTEALYANMPGVSVEDFAPGWRALLRMSRKNYDVFHIHWLERAFWRDSKLAIIRAVCVALLAAAMIKLRGGVVVWTAHDPAPHHMQGNSFARPGFFSVLWKVYSNLLTRMLDGVILLSATHRDPLIKARPYLAKRPFTVTPHPHFKGVYANHVSSSEARHRLALPEESTVLLLIGTIRPYKNAEALIDAFRELPGENLRLVIAGQPDSDSYAETLKARVGDDSRILLAFSFIADDQLQLFLNAADAVVIPFKNATNSGSVALALSFARPVAVPDMPVFREVQDIVGTDWIRLMPDGLTRGALEDVVTWLREARPPEPNLDALDWQQIAGQTVKFFQDIRAL